VGVSGGSIEGEAGWITCDSNRRGLRRGSRDWRGRGCHVCTTRGKGHAISASVPFVCDKRSKQSSVALGARTAAAATGPYKWRKPCWRDGGCETIDRPGSWRVGVWAGCGFARGGRLGGAMMGCSRLESLGFARDVGIDNSWLERG